MTWYAVTPRQVAVRLGLVVLLATLGLPVVVGAPAAASPPLTTSTIEYSLDGGTTWSPNIVTLPGRQVRTRIWYDNTDGIAHAGASLGSSLPAGFTRAPGSTIVCLNPSTTNPATPSAAELVCNTTAGQSGAIDEAAVWAAQGLGISPTAGLFGQPVGQRSGILEIGKKRYVNLTQCGYTTGLDSFTTPIGSGTNADNVAVRLPAGCPVAPSGFVRQASNDAARALDVLGLRYLNLDNCEYYKSVAPSDSVTILLTATAPGFTAGTGTSNAPAPRQCGVGSGGYALQDLISVVANLDLLGQRYVNLQ